MEEINTMSMQSDTTNRQSVKSKRLSERGLFLLGLDREDKKKFLNSFDIVIIDIHGVIWLFVELIPRAGQAIKLLKEAGKQVRFIMNNSFFPDATYISKLNALGVKDVLEEHILHPAKTIIWYLQRYLPGQAVFSLGSLQLNRTLAEHGIVVKTVKPATHLKLKDIMKIKPIDKVGAIILDINFNVTYNQIAKAHQYLQDENCVLIVGSSDSLIPLRKGFNTIGNFGFLNLLRESSKNEPIILGKPSPILGEHVMDIFDLSDPNRVLLIGDSIEIDIQFANTIGFQSLFVLTGVSKPAEMARMSTHMKPNYVMSSLADFIKFFEEFGKHPNR